MQTNIVVDDELLNKAMKLSGQKNQNATIEEALKILIDLHEESSIRKLKGKLHWKGNLNEMREGRFVG